MAHWREELARALDDRRAGQLHRRLRACDHDGATVRRDGRTLINFASNDYLALACHPVLREAVATAARERGVGSGASRLITGHLTAHGALEQRFAAFKHADAALLLPTGFMANLAVLTALAGPGDLVCLDKLNHASLIDAAMASGATVRTFGHLGYDKLERLLRRHADQSTGEPSTGPPTESRQPRRFIVTDSVFSMDGDCADLPALVELRDRCEAVLVVDEAHATGVLGEHGSGLAEHQGVAGRVDVTISTASKAMGSLGGIVTAERVVIETLINDARSFIYTTAAPPTQIAAIEAAMDVIRDEPDRRATLMAHGRRLRGQLRAAGWPVADDPTPIVPVIVGEAGSALALSERLEASGMLVPAIRPPTVPPGSARLRISLRADHTDEQIDRLVAAIGPPPGSSEPAAG